MISKSHPIPPKIDTKANGKFAGPTNQVFVLIVAGDDVCSSFRFDDRAETRVATWYSIYYSVDCFVNLKIGNLYREDTTVKNSGRKIPIAIENKRSSLNYSNIHSQPSSFCHSETREQPVSFPPTVVFSHHWLYCSSESAPL